MGLFLWCGITHAMVKRASFVGLIDGLMLLIYVIRLGIIHEVWVTMILVV